MSRTPPAPPDVPAAGGRGVASGRDGGAIASAPLKMVVILGSLIALGPLTIDMYLPALPAIASDLATTEATVQLTLTGTLLGLAAGQLFVGPLSDAFGRRRPLVAGVMLHVAASLLCLVAPNVAVLGGLRVVQGLGAAATTVVTLAIVRDLFDGRAAATLLSRLMLMLGVAPILAPTIGGGVLQWTTWRGVFVVLAAIGLALVGVAAFLLPETLPSERRQRGGVVGTLRSYRVLGRDGTFVGLALVTGLSMASLFAYVSGSSFVLQEQYGLSEQEFGLVFGFGSVGLIGGTQLSARLLRRYAPEQILLASLVGGLTSSLVFLTTAATGFGGLVGILLPLWVVLAAAGLAMPNAPALALSRHGEIAGTAAALLGAVRYGTGALAAPLVGVLGNDSVAMAVVVASGMGLATGTLLVAVRPSRLLDPQDGAVTAPS